MRWLSHQVGHSPHLLSTLLIPSQRVLHPPLSKAPLLQVRRCPPVPIDSGKRPPVCMPFSFWLQTNSGRSLTHLHSTEPLFHILLPCCRRVLRLVSLPGSCLPQLLGSTWVLSDAPEPASPRSAATQALAGAAQVEAPAAALRHPHGGVGGPGKPEAEWGACLPPPSCAGLALPPVCSPRTCRTPLCPRLPGTTSRSLSEGGTLPAFSRRRGITAGFKKQASKANTFPRYLSCKKKIFLKVTFK